MNKLKRILLLTFSLVIVVSLALVAGGCKGKNKKVTLSFETNGGAVIASVELDKGSEYELPVPTKTDGEFAGWFTDAGFSGESVTKVTVNEDTTVYAKWNIPEKVVLSFETNGGDPLESIEFAKGSEFELPVPTGTIGEFDGWFTDADFSGESVTKVVVAEDMTVYAKWILPEKAILSFETNGGDSLESVELFQGSEYELPIPNGTFGEFIGWYTDADFSGESVTKVTVNEDTTVYAKWLVYQTPPAAVMVIIDRSGSMSAIDKSGKSYLDWAKEGVAECLNALTKRDYFGLISLDNDSEYILKLTSLTQRDVILDAIQNKIGDATGGTVFVGAIRSAIRALKAQTNVDKRHIIIVTDGAVPDNQIEFCEENLRSAQESDGITLSVVGIGLSESPSSNDYIRIQRLIDAASDRDENGGIITRRNPLVYNSSTLSNLPSGMRNEIAEWLKTSKEEKE